MAKEAKILDVLVIGAGPAGIGTALALQEVDDLFIGVVDRGRVGQTFREWPVEQTFLTPSFTGNGFGATDLNAVHPETSPAFSIGVDYLTGAQYAKYLSSVVNHFTVPVLQNTEVTAVEEHPEGYLVRMGEKSVRAHNVVWAGGEWHQPVLPGVRGNGLSVHTKTSAAWEERAGHVVVIGGYESGIDIAQHHIAHGNDVTVVDSETPWDAGTGSDPSFRLAPRTRINLERALATGRLTLVESHAVGIKVASDRVGYLVTLSNGQRLHTDSKPIAATGYGPGLGPVADYFEARKDGWPLVDDNDESTIFPGMFLTGPALRHGGLKFCFVYKFRQRYAHIARVIGESLGKDCGALEKWRVAGMLTDDLSCCGVECAC